MIRFLSDENFHGDVVEGLLRCRPPVDVVRVQDVGLRTRDDPSVLRWAAEQGRVLLTYDRRTMPDYAYERVHSGQPMPGVLVVSRWIGIGAAIEGIVLLAACSLEGEWEGQVRHLPL